MDSDDYSSDEPDELVHLQHVNDQLNADLERLQNQFNEMLNSYPKIEEVNRENNQLKKKLVDANIIIEDYKRRLNLSQNTNLYQQQKFKTNQSDEIKTLMKQVSQLKTKINMLNESHQKEIDDYNQRLMKNEKCLDKIDQENIHLNGQLSKIISLATNYFHIQFQDVQSFCNFLLHPPPITNQNDSSDPNSKSPTTSPDKNNQKRSEEKYKKLYYDEKMKRKKLELDFLKLQKAQETNIFNKEQQKEILADIERKHQNELLQLETNYKKEIQQLKTKEIGGPKSYKTIETQADLSFSSQPTTEAHLEEFSSYAESGQTQDKKVVIEPIQGNEPNNNNNNINTQVIPAQQPIINQPEDVDHLKEQVDNLIDLLRKSEAKTLKFRQKCKQNITTIDKLKKAVGQLRRKNVSLKKKVEFNERNQKTIERQLEKASQEPPISPIDLKNKAEEVRSLKNSMKLIEELTTNQANDIQKLMTDRDKLLNILLLQNQYIHNSEGVIHRLRQRNETQNSLFSSNPVPKNKESNEKVENEKISWEFDNFPESIVSLMKPIAENDCLPVKARIRHVMSVLSKWASNLDSDYKKMVSKNDENTNQISKDFEHFRTAILTTLGEKNDCSEKEIIDKVNELTNNVLTLQQKNNELESMNQKEKEGSQNASRQVDAENLNKLQESYQESKESLKRKQIELKECKAAFLECQRSNQIEIEALKDSNNRARNELNMLQNNYNSLNDQYTQLLNKIDELKNAHQEELTEAQDEIERIQRENSNAINDFRNQAKKSIKSKDDEIVSLQSQLTEANKTIETFEESTRMTIEDMNQSKLKLERYKSKNKEQLNSMKQKEKKFSEMERHYLNTISKLQEQNKILREDNRVKEASDKLRQAEEMISQLETKVIKLNYQIQQDSLKSKSEIDLLERNNKLLIVQNKAKLMSVETDCSIKCDQLKTIYETEKKDFLCYIVQNFKSFFDLRNEMNEGTIKSVIQKIKNELTFLKNLENSIRKLTNAKEGQSTEDALTDLIISMHPQLKPSSE